MATKDISVPTLTRDGYEWDIIKVDRRFKKAEGDPVNIPDFQITDILSK